MSKCGSDKIKEGYRKTNYSKELGLGPWISGRRRDEDSGLDFFFKKINEKVIVFNSI